MKSLTETAATAPAQALGPTAAALAADALAPATRRAYGSALRSLDGWIAREGRERLDDAALGDYCGYMHTAGKAPGTISIAVAASVYLAKSTGQPSPSGPLTARVLKTIRREGADRGRGSVAGIRWEQADAACALAANGGASVQGLRDAAILAVTSDALLRVSEVAALDVADLEAEAPETLTIRRSKTDQDGEGAVQYIGPATVKRVRAYLAAAKIADGKLFRALGRSGVPSGSLSSRSIRTIIQQRAADAGIEGRISGHSLRVGAAQSLASSGAGLVEMQDAGRWRSPSMPAFYARGQSAQNGAVARLRYKS